MEKTNAIAYQSQNQLNAANARITRFMNQMHEVKHERESWKMTVNTYKAKRDIAQQATTIPGAAKLQADVNEVREKSEKLAREAAYYMGLYHQAVPPEHRRGVSFSDRMFITQMNTLLRRGHIPILMDTIWGSARLTPGASSSRTAQIGAPPTENPDVPPS